MIGAIVQGAPYVPLRNATGEPSVVLLGDSYTDRNQPYTSTSATTNPYYQQLGWFIMANAQAGWPLDIVATIGRSGIDSQQLVGATSYTDPVTSVASQTDYVAQALAYKSSYLHLLIGLNDVMNDAISVDTTLANIQNIITRAKAQGTTVILATIPLRGDATTARKAKTFQINQGIRQIARTQPVLFWDLFRVACDPQTGALLTSGQYGLQAGDLSSDTVHLNEYGASLAAAELAKLLTKLPYNSSLQSFGDAAQSFDVMYDATLGSNPRGTLFKNGSMYGTGGTIDSGTGTLATGWQSFANITPTGGSLSYLVESRDNSDIYHRGSWQRITIDGGASANFGRTAIRTQAADVASVAGQAPGASTWQVGDTVFAQCRFETLAGSGTSAWGGSAGNVPTFFSLELETYNGGTRNAVTQGFQNASPGVNTTMRGRWATGGIIRTPKLVIPASTTRLFLWFYLNGIGAIRISDVEARKVV